MNIKPIKSEADYDKVLTVIDGLMGAAPDTPESDELKVLVTLVEAYEAEWLEDRGAGPDLGNRARHGGSWPSPERLRSADWLPATCFGGAQPSSGSHPVDDPDPVNRMEPSDRRTCTRIRPQKYDIEGKMPPPQSRTRLGPVAEGVRRAADGSGQAVEGLREGECPRLKKRVADLSLDKQILVAIGRSVGRHG